MNYIYLIQSLENSYYKIGVSKHPNKRIKQLNTGNPSKTKLIHTYQSDLAYQIEKSIQRKYSHAKKEGEWFDLSIEIEVNFIKECGLIEENLKFLKNNNNVFV